MLLVFYQLTGFDKCSLKILNKFVFTWQCCFIFLCLEYSGRRRMQLLLLLFNIGFFRFVVRLKLIGMLFCASKNNCVPGTNFSGLFFEYFWKLADMLFVLNEKLRVCWITVSWPHCYVWSFSCKQWNDFYSFRGSQEYEANTGNVLADWIILSIM